MGWCPVRSHAGLAWPPRGMFVHLVIYALATLAPVAGLAQSDGEADLGRFVRWSYQDPIDWLGSWNGKRLLHVGAYGAALVPISLLDEDIDEVVRDWESGPILDAANALGSSGALLASVGVFGLTLLTPDSKLQNAAFTSTQAAIYAGLMTWSIKWALGRARPEADLGAYHFDFFSTVNHSFPSGHTTTAFALLTTWVFYYPGYWTYGLFGVAAATGLARMVRRKHWLTDVLGGAGIGTSTAFWLVRKHMGLNDKVSAVPILAPGLFAVSVSIGLN